MSYGNYVAGEELPAADANKGFAPIGAIFPFAGASAPSYWLLCDGSAVSRATYSALFSLIGTTYGIGDGSTTFNLPNLKGKIPVGKDAAQTEFDTIGETGGAKTHTLITSEMPAHTHATAKVAANGAPNDTSGYAATGQNVAATLDSNSTGGGGAHNNLQPYIVVNYIIRY